MIRTEALATSGGRRTVDRGPARSTGSGGDPGARRRRGRIRYRSRWLWAHEAACTGDPRLTAPVLAPRVLDAPPATPPTEGGLCTPARRRVMRTVGRRPAACVQRVEMTTAPAAGRRSNRLDTGPSARLAGLRAKGHGATGIGQPRDEAGHQSHPGVRRLPVRGARQGRNRWHTVSREGREVATPATATGAV